MSPSSGGALGKLLGHAGAGRVRWLGHILVNLSSCVSLNRFQPLPSVTDLEATARELLQQNSFLASKCSGPKCRGGRVPVAVVCRFSLSVSACASDAAPSRQNAIRQPKRAGSVKTWASSTVTSAEVATSAQCQWPCPSYHLRCRFMVQSHGTGGQFPIRVVL